MKSRYNIPALLLLIASLVHAQNPFPNRGVVFQDDEVPRVDILIAESSINQILAPGNEQSNLEHEATFIFTHSEGIDTVNQVGFRLRGNTSRWSAKKSFKVSFNTFLDQKWEGLEKLNLNGEHNDPTVSRAKICWDMMRGIGVPAPRANHVALYINGDYRGLYANVEHIDDELVQQRFGNRNGNLYKCLYPADLAYLGENPDNYKLAPNGRRAYDLRTNEEEDDYSDLANFISIINLTPIDDLPCELEAVFNVDTYLRIMVIDVLTGNWDGYRNQNNFYLYHNTATEKFEYIPYDLDNTMGIDWFGVDWTMRDVYGWMPSGQDRPLFNRILEVPDYRARFSYYMRNFMLTYYNPGNLFAGFDELRDRLGPFVAADDFYTRDYDFSLEDFTDGFGSPSGFLHIDYGLKDFISDRRNRSFQQLEMLNPAPYLYQAQSNRPSVGQEVSFLVSAEDNGSLSEVQLCYQSNGGPETCLNMLDNGQLGDSEASDGIYGLFIEAFNEATEISWYVTATDDEGAAQRLPKCGNYTTQVNSGGLSLAINEYMASNDVTIADEEGEFDDWLEVHNYGSTSINLSGYYLSDNPDLPTKWPFPEVNLEPGEFLLVWADDDEEQGALHTNFKLDADGEFIGIFDTDNNGNQLIDGTDFGVQVTDEAIGRLPNGTGAFQQVSPTPGASNEPVSVGNGIQRKAFEVYPNPVANQLWLETPEAGAYQSILTDATGRTVAQWEWYGEQVQTDLTLPSGMYFLSVWENGQPVFTTKILKH
ncbi:MAG: CotH kinase family protein [Bacteroidota bacterium]